MLTVNLVNGIRRTTIPSLFVFILCRAQVNDSGKPILPFGAQLITLFKTFWEVRNTPKCLINR